MNPLQDIQWSGFFPHHGHTCNFVTVILTVTRVISYQSSPVAQQRGRIPTWCDIMPPVGKTVTETKLYCTSKGCYLNRAQLLGTNFRHCSCNALFIALYKWEKIRYREWKIVFSVRKNKQQNKSNNFRIISLIYDWGWQKNISKG